MREALHRQGAAAELRYVAGGDAAVDVPALPAPAAVVEADQAPVQRPDPERLPDQNQQDYLEPRPGPQRSILASGPRVNLHRVSFSDLLAERIEGTRGPLDRLHRVRIFLLINCNFTSGFFL